ncbi:MAG: peptidylprolyl isomerase [Myxococcota bacterium]|nr:peptidylprolyl isomerase [Myxococcota bacterium]
MTNPVAKFETSMGSFEAEIFVDKMPITGGNFVRLVNEGFYNGLHFHRVIAGFMNQFGCPYSRDPNDPNAGRGKSPHGAIADEHPDDVRISNEPGTLSMANSGPNSGSSQFFINTASNGYLDYFSGGRSKHPVFGKVTSGMDVVTAINNTATGAGDRPLTPVQMISLTIA